MIPEPLWMDDALCRQFDADMWHPEVGEANIAAIARGICESCDVRAECLTYILQMEGDVSHNLRFGVWAGYNPKEREDIARGLTPGQRAKLATGRAA